MFHCPVGVRVIKQHAIILSATVHSPTVLLTCRTLHMCVRGWLMPVPAATISGRKCQPDFTNLNCRSSPSTVISASTRLLWSSSWRNLWHISLCTWGRLMATKVQDAKMREYFTTNQSPREILVGGNLITQGGQVSQQVWKSRERKPQPQLSPRVSWKRQLFYRVCKAQSANPSLIRRWNSVAYQLAPLSPRPVSQTLSSVIQLIWTSIWQLK